METRIPVAEETGSAEKHLTLSLPAKDWGVPMRKATLRDYFTLPLVVFYLGLAGVVQCALMGVYSAVMILGTFLVIFVVNFVKNPAEQRWEEADRARMAPFQEWKMNELIPFLEREYGIRKIEFDDPFDFTDALSWVDAHGLRHKGFLIGMDLASTRESGDSVPNVSFHPDDIQLVERRSVSHIHWRRLSATWR